jgi:ATP-dependent Clp protease protease subunit
MSSYTIPYVVQHTPRGERTMDLYSRLLADRIIYLGTELDDGVANTVIAQLLHLASEAPDSPVSLYVNSPGGSITAMLAVYDAMQYIACDVATTCVGQAAATAAMLLAGGTPGKRLTLPNARILIHQPSSGFQGQSSDIEIHAREVLELRRLLEEIYAQHTGRTVEEVHEDMERDRFFGAEEAVEYGLVDRLVPSRRASLSAPGAR